MPDWGPREGGEERNHWSAVVPARRAFAPFARLPNPGGQRSEVSKKFH